MKNRDLIAYISLLSISILFFIAIIYAGNNDKNYYPFPIFRNNMLLNGDFSNDLSYWDYDANITIEKTNAVNNVRIENKSKKQIRLWQNVNVISGKTYKLTFTLNGQQKGAFSIYKDSKTGKESYLFCRGNNGEKKYEWIIKPNRTGNNQIYLSTNEIGTYYYSKVSLNEVENIIYLIIRIVLFLLLLVLIILYICFLKHNYIFTIGIIVLMIFPVCKTIKKNKSEFENRNLAQYKPIIVNSKINKNFGIDFNNWLNDRFWIRNFVLLHNNSLDWYVNRRIDNKFILSGRNGWLFLKSNIMRILRSSSFYDEFYDKTVENIVRFKEFCDSKNAKLFLLVAPYGEELYESELIGVNLKNKTGGLESIINNLRKDTGVEIEYAYKQLENAKTNALVFFKTDHHWTPYGAYNAYLVLMDKIYQSYNISALTYDSFIVYKKHAKFGFGETYKRINNVSRCAARSIYPISEKYLYFTFKGNNKVNDVLTHSNVNFFGNHKLFIFGDSFVNIIKDFFEYSFCNTTYFVKPLQIYMPDIEKKIAEKKPEIIIMIIYSQNFELIQNWYNKR